MDLIWIALAGLAGIAFGTIFSQRVKDWFAGVEGDIRAKATEAGKAVLAAAAAEEAKVRDAARAAADKAVDGAKQAAGLPLTPAEPAPPPVAPAA